MSFSANKDTAKLLLEGASLFGLGLVAGSGFYIDSIEVPARKDKPPAYQLENYHQVFPRAAGLMKPFGMFMLVITGSTFYVTKKPMWLVSVALVGCLGPFTAIVIQPTNNKLMDTPEKEAAKVSSDLKAWGKLNNVRTVMSLAAFGAAIAAVL